MADIEYHFQKLTPLNNADINVYEKAIDFVFKSRHKKCGHFWPI